jgi:hypothetical protein
MPIRDYDPTLGQAFQGDVAIVPMPADITIAQGDEIKPVDGRLVVQEGEATGHHHAVALPRGRRFRPLAAPVGDPLLATRSPLLRRMFGGGRPSGRTWATARLFRDRSAVQAMVSRGLLTRADFAIGCLVVEGGPVVLTHEEHDGIRLPPGNYYVGRQMESAGVEARIVID